ncbi:5-oxoprolinase subunit PxpB [Idiomarina sp. M1R2S28]|uniref:5-oxoprolinase subunit PxpB n=1 Tax=Idiomarina rhizosphaerae TaxID=2961572 RepID=A0A9X2FZ84_9GAMM|nr:5-oxoprolinase subunit PxpB [Idiomarina rhizosphaerae]MCP1340224.1 5-oxoprolinase subunit PxpB [Idiomarina rhizosphaerae]
MSKESDFPKLVSAGADAVIVYLGEGISVSVNQRVLAAVKVVKDQLSDVVLDLVPSYNSLMVYYNVLSIDEPEIRERLRKALADLSTDSSEQSGKRHRIPVYYDESVGPDLARIADMNNCSVDDVIKMHTEQTYRVYAMGFAPGFAYLGEVAKKLRTPRLDNPRKRITAGSVAIAESQTAVYPSASPGGWNIIGRTSTQLYNPSSGTISPLNVGDEVEFYAVSKEQFIEEGGDTEALS